MKKHIIHLIFLLACFSQTGLAQNFDGTFTITNKGTGQRLDADESEIYVHEPNGGDYQKWIVQPAGEKFKHKIFTITSKATGKRLDGNGDNFYPEDPNQHPYQRWWFVEAEPGFFNIVNVKTVHIPGSLLISGYDSHTEYCLSGKMMTVSVEFGDRSSPYCQWKIEKEKPPVSADNTSFLKNNNTFTNKIVKNQVAEKPYQNNLPDAASSAPLQIFRGENFSGNPTGIPCQNIPNLLKIRFSPEQIKSMKVEEGYAIVLFLGENFTGQAVHATGELPNFKKGSPDGNNGFFEVSLSDRIKSMLVWPKNALILFSEENYGGNQLLVDMASNGASDQKYTNVLPN